MAVRSTWSLFITWSLLGACADPTAETSLPTPDAEVFQLEVYPVLLRDCGFPACHGNPSRFFRVFGPGRTRYEPDTALFAPATAEELELTYYRARSMLTHEGSIEQATLLRKPLYAGHKGVDAWGVNVYQSRRDPGYATLAAWAETAQASASEQAVESP